MTDDTLFRVVAGGLMAVGMTVGLYRRVRAARAGGGVSRRDEPLPILIPLRLCGVMVMGSLVLYLIRPAWMAWAAVPLPAWLRWAGAALAAGGVVWTYFALRALGTNLTDTVAIRPNHTLVTRGPYRLVRHPFYVGGAAVAFGLFLVAALWVPAAVAVVVAALLVARTPIEEAKLIERFGDDYRRYAARTGRFLPRLGGG